jgi:quercetin dioxygenase-like cupin family protein
MGKRALLTFTAILLCALPAAAEEPPKPAASAPADHGFFSPAEMTWGPGPPSLPAGAKLAVLEGDPTKEGIFTFRLSAPAGYKIPPHWHPAFEHVTVISGAFSLGMGDTFDQAKLKTVPAGGFSYMAPGMRHFAWVEKDTVVQLHGMGPWQLYYVNPADDPRSAAKK